MVDPRDQRNRRMHHRNLEMSPPCHCRSKSLEDVRPEVVEYNGDWGEDYNGNRILRRQTNSNSSNGSRINGKSMENLVVDTGHHYPSPRRIGSYQV